MAKYVAYPEYKDSGVEWFGELPAHWTKIPVGAVADVIDPQPDHRAPALAADGQGFPYIGIRDVNLDGSLNFETARQVNESAVVKQEKSFAIEENDLIFCKVGTLGLPRKIQPHGRCALSATLVLVKAKKVDSGFLLYALDSTSTVGQTDFLSTGSTRAALGIQQIRKFQLPFPPEGERKAIANFLDHETAKIDTLIEEQQSLIRLLKEKRQAVISHAVTKGLNPDAPMKDSGVEWLGEVPEHWDLVPLRHLTSEVTVGIVVTPAKYYADSGIPCFRSLNVKENYIQESDFVYISEESNELLEKSKIKTDDIVVVRTGQPGTAAVVTEKYDGANCIDLIIIRRSKKLDSQFLSYQLNSEFVKHQVSMGSGGAIQQHFNVEIAKSLLICSPPLEEQESIRQFIQHQAIRFQQLTTDAEEQVTLLQERRTALISAAVTGKIDVRDWIAPKQKQSATEAVS